MNSKNILSEKLKPLRVVNNYKFRFYRTLANDVQRWVCCKKTCNAAIKYDVNGAICEQNTTHNHEPDDLQSILRQKVFKSLVYVLASIQLVVCALPNTFEMPSNGVLPSPVTYFEGVQNENKTNAGRSHEARFGYIPSSFGGASSGMGGYQGNSMSTYGSQKIDIGGLIVGAVVGLGILIFIPKILYLLFATTNIFSAQPVGNGYSGYGRSEELMSGLNDMVTKLEESMSKYNINTTECMQKALCTYIQSTEQVKEKSGINNFVDNSINTLTKNSLMNFMIDGSRFKAALEAGKNGECKTAYRQCPFDQNSIYMFLRQISTKK